uniref:G-patch domain-containing protein n=1 Tax=Ditylum brightwellii TaxID=49249 RepID=A0A6U3RUZ0_9STRA|mmetsp:Transcript_28828/g.42846  ORF Transcript_28828/g.42846 Transcript_28828/m.42846 type:complete len:279 (+) Transcript_28828:82-918(+)
MAYANVSTSKHRAKLGATLNESASTCTPLLNTSSFSHKQLLAMGWTPGEGLGKRSNGLKSHISAKKRDDGLGLGMEGEERKQRQAGEEWWRDGLGDTLARLSSSSSKKKKSKEKKNNAKKRFTDEELFKATGGARFGMRAQVRAEGKWARTERSLGEHEEKELKSKIEWNGLGNAKVLLHSNSSSSADVKEDQPAVVTEEESAEETNNVEHDHDTKEKKKKKKKKESKKRSRKEEEKATMKSSKRQKISESNEDEEEKDKKKRSSKKDKKKKKHKKDK